eukprot:45008_1
MNCFTDNVDITSIDFKTLFSSMKFDELVKVKHGIITIDQMVMANALPSSIHLFKELNFHGFISDECDIDGKNDRLQFICDILEGSDFCSTFNPITSIDLSANYLNDNDLTRITKAIQNNEKCGSYFANIHSINIGFNLFTNTEIIDRFLKMLGVKFPNLRSLNLEQNGILCSIYHRDVLHSFGLNPSVMITWLSAQTQDIDYDSSSNFSFQFDEDDEEEDTDEDDHHSSDIFTANCDETMAHLYDHDDDDSEDEDDNDIHKLEIAYSVR